MSIAHADLEQIVGAMWFCKKVYEEWESWKERRQWRKKYQADKKAWENEHHWEPRMVGGADCGEWVRNDGRPIDDNAWTPMGALLERLAERGPGSG